MTKFVTLVVNPDIFLFNPIGQRIVSATYSCPTASQDNCRRFSNVSTDKDVPEDNAVAFVEMTGCRLIMTGK